MTFPFKVDPKFNNRLAHIAKRRSEGANYETIAQELGLSRRQLLRYRHIQQYWHLCDNLLQQQLELLPKLPQEKVWSARMDLLRLMWPKDNNTIPPTMVDINVNTNNNTNSVNLLCQLSTEELCEYQRVVQRIVEASLHAKVANLSANYSRE